MGRNLLYRIIKFLFGLDISALLDKNHRIPGENEDLIRERVSLQGSVQDIRNQLDEKEKQIVDQNNKVEHLKAENATLQLTYKQALADMEILKQKSSEQEGAISELKAEKDILDQKFKQEYEQKSALQAKLETITAEKLEEQKHFQNENSLLAERNAVLTRENTNLKEEAQEKEKTIQEQQAKINSSQSTNNAENITIRDLKETISQLQSEAKKDAGKDGIIEELRLSVKKSNELVAGLQSEIERFSNELNKKQEIEITHSDSASETFQKVDGAAIVHKDRNVGKRTEKQLVHEENSFEYLGKFLFDLKSYTQTDSAEFPDVFYPQKDTPVLRWHEVKSNATVGVTEPLLFDALKTLKNYLPGIDLLQNVALSIKNRTYSYVPDIALYLAEFNLCIDIEIDEPYDIVSRKPLHYKGSSDYLRNLYFTRQGWVVIRLSEEQIIQNIDFCVKYVAAVIRNIIKVQTLDALLDDFVVKKQKRWTYEEAMEYSKSNYREEYLKLEVTNETVDQERQPIEDSPFIGIPPADDILPEEDYSTIEKQLNEIKTRYLKITFYPFENQIILDNYTIEKKEYKVGLSGFDIVDEKNEFVPFEKVKEIEGLNSPFKYPLYNSSSSLNDEKLNALVKEAIYNYNPIRIEYSDAKSNITFRNISLISYSSDSKEFFGDKIWENYYEKVKDPTIVAFCLLRNDQRTFYIHRIRAIQIFNCKKIGIGQINSLPVALWYPLMKQDFTLCEHISKLIPAFFLEDRSFSLDNYFYSLGLIASGNYAHYLLLSGQSDKALEIYRKQEGKKVNENYNWQEMNLEDFKELSVIGDYREKFEEAKRILKWNQA